MSSTTTSATSASVPASATTAAATTPLATTTTKSGLMRGGDVYKGKYTNRSWQQLPPDIIRIIATHYLVDFTASTYIPHTWLTKEMWHNRVVYTVLRDANDLERLMRVSPAWKAALETHLFWYQACSIIDPHDTLAQHIHTNPLIPSHHSSHAPRQTPSPYRHFRTLTSTSCIVCLINAPPATYISTGLFLAKRTHPTPTLGVVTLCKDHRRAFFCGVCLREAPVSECEPETGYRGAGGLGLTGFGMGGFPPPWGTFAGTMGANAMAGISPYAPIHPSLMVCCAENEDDETWPGVETTCRSCRTEFLWRRISGSERDREAIGGALYAPTKSHAPNNNSSTTTVSQPLSSHSQLTSNMGSSTPSTLSSWPPTFHSTDYQTRQTVDAFIELGEGSISEVLCVAREKLWLRKETKMVELMGQALAAARWEGGGGMGDNMNMEEMGGLVEERAPEETLLATEWEGEVGNGKSNLNAKGKKTVSEDGRPLSRSTSVHSDVPQRDDAPSHTLLDDVHSYTSSGGFEAEQDVRSDVAEAEVRSTHSYDYGFDTSRLSQDRDRSSPSSSELPCLLKDSSLSTQDDTDASLHVDLSRGFPTLSPSDDDDACSNFSDRSDTSDPDLLTLTEDLGGIRELAILDWARGRILDGWWCSPADEWYGYVSGKRGNDDDVEGDDGGWRTVRAVHPCPWSVSGNLGSSAHQHQYRQTSMTASRSANHSPPSYCSPCLPSSQSHNRVIRPKLTHSHPLSRTIDAPTPPSFALCEQAYRAYQKQLRLILLPAMKNIVKRMVAEAGASENGRVDPATRAARMSMEEVLTELRTPGVWFDRVDWIVVKDEQVTATGSGSADDSLTKEDDGYSERGLRMDGKKNDEDVESSSTGTERSDGSHATSPVLSTTTLRTTPSPSPVREKEETFSSVAQKSTTSLTTSPSAKSTAGLNTKLTIVPIPISPVLESPSLLHPIPYVPLTSQGMPQYSMEAFKSVWREACAPLYSCRCAICERTLIKLQLAATFSGGVRPSEPVQVPVQSQNQLIYATHPQQRAVDVVRLEEQSPRRFFEEEEEEEEEEVYAEEEEESEEGDDLEFSSDEAENDAKTRAGRRDLRVVGDPGTIGKIYLSLPPQVHTRQTQQSVTPRKRSSGDLDGDHVDRDSGNGAQETNQSQKSGTPPKRPRREASDTNPVLAVTAPTPDNRGDAESKARSSQCSTPAEQVKSSTPTRQRKRSSEEIDTSGDNVSVGNGGNRESVDNAKRARVDNREMLKAGLVKGGELDGLYVFEAESGGVDMS